MTDNMVHVLFIDDEPNVLAGLKRMSRTHKDDWTSHFCGSGEEALALMATLPVDVVVSDMRMPFMDGAEFLSIVRRRHPGTVRVILSGYADAECVLRTVGPAHLYLAKPCQPEALAEAIARPLALRRLLSEEGLREAIAGLTNLPSPPELFYQLETELRSPTASVASVAAIIRRDMAMTVELLKLTNSAYFSLGAKASTPLQAVHLLGMETVEALVLRIGIFRQLKSHEAVGPLIRQLNDYGLQIGNLAERIAAASGADGATSKAAFCAGMLCCLGNLVLLDAYPDRYPRLAEKASPSLLAVEEAAFGASHPLVGAYLLGLWGFADPVVEAVAYSMAPSACPGRDNQILTAVHAARALGPVFPLFGQTAKQQPVLDMNYVCECRKDLLVAQWRQLAQAITGGGYA